MNQNQDKPGGLDRLRGVWLALLILRMVITTIDPQKVKDSNPRSCTTPPLTTKNKRFEPKTTHYTTIDPKICLQP
jgi:hypothetical protein